MFNNVCILKIPSVGSMLLKCGVVLAISFSLPSVAKAEGRCPPGQYPIGGQGAGGCAPIPTSSGGAPISRPTGKWIKTWGAIAVAPNGASGTVTGKLKKAEAVQDALAKCSSSGGSDCEISVTYKNQCVAAVVAQSGHRGTEFGLAGDEAKATAIGLKACGEANGKGCEVIYTACSDPYFHEF